MFRLLKITLVALLMLAFIISSGCVYYNTFFMAKKKFNEAEKNQREALENLQRQQPNQRGNQGGRNAGRSGGNRAQGNRTSTKVNPQDKLLYEDVIKKAGRVLKFHPNSKYVDDALWLIGKSYYNMGDYLLSERKFTELVTNHPESKFVDDSYFYMAMCQIELENIESALKALNEIEYKYPKSGYFDEVLFVRGSISKKTKNYSRAIDQFNLYLGKYPKGDSAGKSLFYIGECKNELGNNFESYRAYYAVRDKKPSKLLYFDATIAAAVAAIEADSIKIGMDILKKLAKDERYFENSPKIKLRIANGYLKQGFAPKAIEEYTEVTVQSPRTPESSEAYYNLGLIYQNELFDIDKAKENFTKAKSESSNSDFAHLALSKSAQIAKLETYQVQLQRADSITLAKNAPEVDEPDSTVAPDSIVYVDSTNVNLVEALVDSMSIDTTETLDLVVMVDSTVVADTIDIMYQDSLDILPGVSLIQYPDSSFNVINDSSRVSIQPGSDTTLAQIDSLDMPIAIDPGTIDTLTGLPDTSITQYPDSNYNDISDSVQVSLQPGVDTTLTATDPLSTPDTTGIGTLGAASVVNADSIEAVRIAAEDSVRQSIINDGIVTRFLLAELFAYELNRPDSALREYLQVAEEHPSSSYAPRALLASAYIEFNRNDSSRANELLDRLLTEYPQSPQTVQAAELLNTPIDLSHNAIGIYTQAENLIYIENNPDSAIILFDYISDNFPDLAAKASLAKAWTLDQIIGVTDSSAFFAYAYVKKNFPDTPYSAKAKARIEPDSKAKRRQVERRKVENELDAEQSEAMADSLRQLAQVLPNAPRVITLGDFLYPEELFHRDLKGQVLFKIKIDVTGQVIDHQIIGPSGHHAIDSVATKSLLETEFDTSSLDFAKLDSFFKYAIPFERPEVDIFNDPYRDERERRY